MVTMDKKVINFYKSIYDDVTMDREESVELVNFLRSINPPPDKMLWLRSTAFRVGCDFLSSEESDGGIDREHDVSLLRTINCIVHAVESVCMQPKASLSENGVPVDEDAVSEFYRSVYGEGGEDDVVELDQNENNQLYTFFRQTNPPHPDSIVQMRALVFKVGCEYLSEESKDKNVQLLRCMNSMIRAFERSCYDPKPFQLEMPQTPAVQAGLQDMSLQDAVQHLWDLDDNRLDPNHDFTIDIQEGKKPYWKEDKAEDPLFQYVDQSILYHRPTYKTFVALLDNYHAETGVKEVITDAERKETYQFLYAIMETKPMQFCHQYCRSQKPDEVPQGKSDFIKLLHKIWFYLYRREASRDSCGFEHVFVGEIRDGKISGFHNWIQFYLEERRGNVDYRGYVKPKNRSDALADNYDHLLSLQFRWKGVEKFVGTSFLGVSPEFEFALYTICFLVGGQDNRVELHTGGHDNDVFGLSIKCYRMSRDKIGTCYPEITSHFEE